MTRFLVGSALLACGVLFARPTAVRSDAGADVSVTKECTPAVVEAGGLVSCTITVANAGPLDAPNIWVLDDLPDNAVYRDDLSDTAFCDGPMVFPPYSLALDNVVQCGTIGLGVNSPISLQAQASIELHIVYEAAPNEFDGLSTNRVIALAAGFGLPVYASPDDPDLTPLMNGKAALPPCDATPDPLTCAFFSTLAAPPAANNSAEATVTIRPPDLLIDADPTNGTRPCDPIDLERLVSYGTTYSVAVCYEGSPGSLQLGIDYDGLLTDVPDDPGTAPDNVDGNPDLNDGPASDQVGTNWDCSLGGTNPPSGANPATLICSGTGTLAVTPGHIATLELVAAAEGSSQLSFVEGSTLIDGIPCGQTEGSLLCVGATFEQQPPPPASCELSFSNVISTGPGTFGALPGQESEAHGRIPAFKDNLTLRVKDGTAAVIAQTTSTGIPGQQISLPFTAQLPGPLTVECLVDDVVEDTDLIEILTADLSVTKECTPAVVEAGGLVSCTITVANAGPLDAPNIWVLDDLPDNAVYRDDLSDAEYCELIPQGALNSLSAGLVSLANVVQCGTIGLTVTTPISLTAQSSIEIDVVYEAEVTPGSMSTNRVLALPATFGLPVYPNPADPELTPLVNAKAALPPCSQAVDPTTCATLSVLAAPPQVDNSAEASVTIRPPDLLIDADPTNGTRPCDPVDYSRSVIAGDTHAVAICAAGDVSAIGLSLTYNDTLSDAVDNPGTAPNHLDGNPNLNDGNGAGQLGNGWDCSIDDLNLPAGAQPAMLSCEGTPAAVAAYPRLIATVELQALSAGLQALTLAGSSFDDDQCKPLGTMDCGNAAIQILPPPPATCALDLHGAWSTDGFGTYTVGAGSPMEASAQIPAGASGLTLRVSRSGLMLWEETLVGSPGDPASLWFAAAAPGPLTVECLVDAAVQDTATLHIQLIDPSGRVYDGASGASIVGATVVLEFDDDPGAGETWVALDPVTHAGLFDPEVNPETTGLDGRYAWDVAPGDYRVLVTAAGCDPVTSMVVTIPPPVTDLDIAMACLDTDGDGLRNIDEALLLGTSAAASDSDFNGTDDGDEDFDRDGLSNAEELNAHGSNPLDPDTDADGVADGLEVALGTNPTNVDTDGDGYKDAQALLPQSTNTDTNVDNCPTVANPDQTNADAMIVLSNGPTIPGDDVTRPNSDALGDACDPDSDNDGRTDAEELGGIGCGGVITEVSTDNAYSDGDPPSWDTDGDAVPDGVECALGANPTDAGSKPSAAACGGSGDSDGDGLQDTWETCKWGTSNSSADSDGDGLGDCIEVMDVNGNGSVNASDATQVLQHFFGIIVSGSPFVGDLASMDVNGNGQINASDATLILQAFFDLNPCI